MSEERAEVIAEFLAGHIRASLGRRDDIFALGFVSSLFAMQLVAFLEKRFGITVENEDLEIDNFRTIDAMTALLERKLG